MEILHTHDVLGAYAPKWLFLLPKVRFYIGLTQNLLDNLLQVVQKQIYWFRLFIKAQNFFSIRMKAYFSQSAGGIPYHTSLSQDLQSECDQVKGPLNSSTINLWLMWKFWKNGDNLLQQEREEDMDRFEITTPSCILNYQD